MTDNFQKTMEDLNTVAEKMKKEHPAEYLELMALLNKHVENITQTIEKAAK